MCISRSVIMVLNKLTWSILCLIARHNSFIIGFAEKYTNHMQGSLMSSQKVVFADNFEKGLHVSLLHQQTKCLNTYFAMWPAIWLRFQHRHGRGKGWPEEISPMRLFIFHRRGEKRVVLQLKCGWHCWIIPASVMKGGRHFHLCRCALKTTENK